MRLIAFVLAAFAVSGPAAAQTWQEYSYPDNSFAVSFPADPQIETTTYQVADGRPVPARVYSVRQNNGVFKVTVADLANTGLQESAVSRTGRLGSRSSWVRIKQRFHFIW